ncbi:hypothetical protein [Brenneria uluponensis]|uniref:hypothetical protein n=1 Tax=Brenneria uluponensis TaxID=3057057 RepID=UPI0028E86E93|nr:hypothetical protein [Brenneria ulupoensis]
MEGSFNGQCPLCGIATKYNFADHQNVKQYSCYKCKTIQISLHAERLLAGIPSIRAALAERAGAMEGHEAMDISVDDQNALDSKVIDKTNLLK